MLSFINFNSEVETKDQYYERMAQVVNAIRTGAFYDGVNLQLIYTEHALKEVEKCIMEIIREDVICVAIKMVSENSIFYMKEDFVSDVMTNVLSEFHKYNNPDYRIKGDDGEFKKANFSNFVRFCAKKSLRDLLRGENGTAKRMDCKQRKIDRTKEYIMKTTGANEDMITPEIIEVYMEALEKNPLTADEIREALVYKISVVPITDELDNVQASESYEDEFDYTDEHIEDFLREWIESQEAYKQMIFLQNCKFCPGVYCDMSLEDFACDYCYIKAVKMCPTAAKNIKPADENFDSEHVSINQISRHRGYTFDSFKDYVRQSGIPEDELRHQVEKFFLKYWDELIEKIMKEN